MCSLHFEFQTSEKTIGCRHRMIAYFIDSCGQIFDNYVRKVESKFWHVLSQKISEPCVFWALQRSAQTLVSWRIFVYESNPS